MQRFINSRIFQIALRDVKVKSEIIFLLKNRGTVELALLSKLT